jgi:hypothetical protein
VQQGRSMSALERFIAGRGGILVIGAIIIVLVFAIDQLLRALDPSLGVIEPIQRAKYRAEIRDFYQEIVVLNGPRYRELAQWPRLWIDFWNALFACHYTLGHLVGIGLPVYWLAAAIRRLLLTAVARGQQQ